jgi:hypothetical protein
MDRIVSMTQHNGRVLVATENAVYDITDQQNPIIITTSKCLDKMLMGKKYKVEEIR